LGVKSGTVGDVVEPVTSSPIVRANGVPIQRHGNRCTLNKGNTDGEYCYVESTDTRKAPDGNDEQNKSFFDGAREQAGHFWSGMKATSDEASFVDGAVNKIGQWYNGEASMLEDAKGLYNSLPTGAEIWEGTQNIGRGVADVGGKVINDPLGSAQAAKDYVVDGVEGAVDSVEKGYDKHGVSGALGAGTGVLAGVISPGKKLKMLKEAGEGLEEAGDIGKVAREAEHARDSKKAEDASENVDGSGGGRVTRRFHVECFDLPDNLKDKAGEYKRQLDEQTDYINSKMTADDMAYAHWVLEKAGGTGALRQSYQQTKHRNLYKQYLRQQGKTESEIDDAVEGQAATHFLDMVAGGNPSVFSTDPKGNPVLGDSEVNSYIGNQWTQKGRAASLRTEAENMRRNGTALQKMNVELRLCE